MTEEKADLIINLLTSINDKLNPVFGNLGGVITSVNVPYYGATIEENKKIDLVIQDSPIYSLEDVKALVLKLVTKDEENRTYIREVLATEFNVATIKDIADNSKALTKLYIILEGKIK